MPIFRSTKVIQLLAIFVLAVQPAVAEAKQKPTAVKSVVRKIVKASHAKRNHHNTAGTHAVSTTKVSSRVEGGSTGDGPLTDADCAEVADDINHSLDEMEDALLDGDDTAASAWSGIANTVADSGLDGGCFFTGIE